MGAPTSMGIKTFLWDATVIKNLPNCCKGQTNSRAGIYTGTTDLSRPCFPCTQVSRTSSPPPENSHALVQHDGGIAHNSRAHGLHWFGLISSTFTDPLWQVRHKLPHRRTQPPQPVLVSRREWYPSVNLHAQDLDPRRTDNPEREPPPSLTHSF